MCRTASARLEMLVYNLKQAHLHGAPSFLQKATTSRNQPEFKCKFR